MISLIEQFNRFLEDASNWPVSYWGHKLYSARKSFVSQLDEIKLSFKEKDSMAFKSIEPFITILNQDIDELRLAQAMQVFADEFARSGKKDARLELFTKLSDKFLKKAQLFENYKKKREKLTTDEKKKKAFDQKLFKNEGVFYCLEYYLSVFKKLSELKTTKEKQQFIESKEIDLGFGKLPGLKVDLLKDEVLEKFILLILDDITRERILTSYYALKNTINDNINILDFEKTFKKFIYYLLLSFRDNGIDKLSSKFLKPYGDQPAVADLISLFETYDK